MSIRELCRDLLEHIPAGSKHVLDALSIATLLGSLVSMLPAIATVMTIIWTGLRIYQVMLDLGDRRRKARQEAGTDANR